MPLLEETIKKALTRPKELKVTYAEYCELMNHKEAMQLIYRPEVAEELFMNIPIIVEDTDDPNT